MPRSEAQEKANAGSDEGLTAVRPTGAWVEAAKELIPPPPPPEVTETTPKWNCTQMGQIAI